MSAWERSLVLFVFFKQKTAYDITRWLEFRRVLFRSLAGAVRPDDREDLALADGEAHVRQRRQRAEALGDRRDLEDYAVARHCLKPRSRRKPSSPLGMKRTITMRTTPMTMKYQSTYEDTLSRRIVKTTPPMIGPTRVPRPPIITEIGRAHV